MKLIILDNYLLKDISNIILDYLYKPDIKKLNEEYHRNVNILKCCCSDFCESIHVNVTLQDRNISIMNYRHLIHTHYFVSTASTSVTYLPNRYKYSSGMNYSKGYHPLYRPA